jgi:hypothetical protein
MKIVCPVCGVAGHLQVRGNSARVLHYNGFVNGRRVYVRHKVEINGNQTVEINKAGNSIFSDNTRGCRLAWSRLVDLGSIDPGSNPGSPTIGPELK